MGRWKLMPKSGAKLSPKGSIDWSRRRPTKNIGSAARRQIGLVFDRPVLLSQRVKVRKGWAGDRRAVASLGYGG